MISSVWLQGPRVRAGTLKVGARFVAIDGRIYRITGWLHDRAGGCPQVVDVVTKVADLFAGCAEVVRLPRAEQPQAGAP